MATLTLQDKYSKVIVRWDLGMRATGLTRGDVLGIPEIIFLRRLRPGGQLTVYRTSPLDFH